MYGADVYVLHPRFMPKPRSISGFGTGFFWNSENDQGKQGRGRTGCCARRVGLARRRVGQEKTCAKTTTRQKVRSAIAKLQSRDYSQLAHPRPPARGVHTPPDVATRPSVFPGHRAKERRQPGPVRAVRRCVSEDMCGCLSDGRMRADADLRLSTVESRGCVYNRPGKHVGLNDVDDAVAPNPSAFARHRGNDRRAQRRSALSVRGLSRSRRRERCATGARPLLRLHSSPARADQPRRG